MSDESENLGTPNDALRIPAPAPAFRIENAESPISGVGDPKADVDFWCRMATWTIEESAALAFGKDPEVVTWTTLEPHLGMPFVESYRRIRKLAFRARDAGRLTEPCPPLEFIGWMQENGIPFSEQLAAAVFDHTELVASRKREAERARSAPVTSDAAVVNPKSFNTLLKLLGGLVVAIYKPDPAQKRSDVYKTIQSDLDLVGVNLDLDTIRKWAKAGVRTAEIL